MEAVTFATHVITQVLTSISHNWPYLLLGIVSASAIKLYVGIDRIAGLLRRRTPVAVGVETITTVCAAPGASENKAGATIE